MIFKVKVKLANMNNIPTNLRSLLVYQYCSSETLLWLQGHTCKFSDSSQRV